MVKLQKARKIGLSSPLGDDVLLFRKMTATEELGRLFEFELELLSKDHEIQFEDVLGKNLTVRLDLAEDEHRHFDGIVSRFCQVGTAGGHAVYHASIRPWLWLLSRTANCRIFQNTTVPDIVKTVFRDRGFSDFDEQLAGEYRTWEYCVQYRETDFHFISRLLEQEGIYYYFRHDEDAHTLVLADSPDAHARAQGYEKIPYRPPGRTGAEEVDYVTDLFIAKDLQPGAYALSDYDFERPRAGLDVKSSMPRPHAASDFEIFDYPGEYIEEQHGNTYARTRLEELQAHYERVQGKTNARGLAVGNLFELSEHPRDDQNREYLIVSAAYELASNEFESDVKPGEEVIYSCHLETIPSRQPYRTPGTTPKPVVQGPQTAVVVGPAGEKVWPDKYGRVKVQFHWDRNGQEDENSSCWIRVSQTWAGGNWGGMHIPHVGQEVIVEFLEGDPDRPIITGRVYNADQMPPFKLPDDKHKSVLRDDYGNEIVFDATPGDEHIRLHSPHHYTTMELGRSDSGSTESDLTRTVKGNQLEAVAGTKGELTAGVRYEGTIGVEAEATVGAHFGFMLGGSHTMDLGYRWDYSWAPDVRQSQRDILTTAKMDQIMAAGDQMSLVGGAKEAGQGRSIVNVFPEGISLSVGEKNQTRKLVERAGQRWRSKQVARGDLFDPSPDASTVAGVFAAATLASVMLAVTSAVGQELEPSKMSPLQAASVPGWAVLLLALSWIWKKELKDEKIEPVTFAVPKARIKIAKNGSVSIVSNDADAEILIEKPAPAPSTANRAHISLDPAGNINITTPKQVLIWGEGGITMGKGRQKVQLTYSEVARTLRWKTGGVDINFNGAIKVSPR